MPKRLAQHLRPLNDREERLDELYSRWNEVVPTLRGSRALGQPDYGSGEEGCALMPLAWNLSYRKLEILMRYMAHLADHGSSAFKGMHSSLCSWYGQGSWRRTVVESRDQQTGKKRKTEEMVFFGGQDANPAEVLAALEWISGHFPGEVYLPDDFTRSAQEQMARSKAA